MTVHLGSDLKNVICLQSVTIHLTNVSVSLLKLKLKPPQTHAGHCDGILSSACLGKTKTCLNDNAFHKSIIVIDALTFMALYIYGISIIQNM